jgi:hypothetical protein
MIGMKQQLLDVHCIMYRRKLLNKLNIGRKKTVYTSRRFGDSHTSLIDKKKK